MRTRDITLMDHKVIENPALNVVLFQPEIPANTGNIARLCGATQVRLHLVYPLGFEIDNKHLRRAGLDYWYEVDVRHHSSFEAFLDTEEGNLHQRLITFSKYAQHNYTDLIVDWGFYLVFGKETIGLPEEIRDRYPCYKIPIWGRVRSLNLSSAVGIVVYHYLHQMGRF